MSWERREGRAGSVEYVRPKRGCQKEGAARRGSSTIQVEEPLMTANWQIGWKGDLEGRRD